MPRPHTEFLKTAAMRWRPVPGHWVRPGCEHIVMSEDPASGACSVLLRYPAEWKSRGASSPDCDEEIYVLEGEIEIADQVYRRGDYAYLPTGFPRERMQSAQGCTLVTFFEASPVPLGERVFDTRYLITKLETSKLAWSAPSDQTLIGGRVKRKVLKPFAVDGGRTWLLGIDATSDAPFEINGIERHPCVEEMILLDGDMSMSCGVMEAGDYFWRPPMIPHGPMGTRSGFLGLFRAKEGGFSTEWSDAPEPINWDAPYRPILPAQ